MDSIKAVFNNEVNNLKTEYTKQFVNTLVILKVILLTLFIIITINYYIKQKKFIVDRNFHVYTMLQSPEYFKKLILASSMDAIFGVLSFIFIIVSRGGYDNMWKNIIESYKEIILVAIILFLFRFTQESSGFNRWITTDSGIYKKLDKLEIENLLAKEPDLNKRRLLQQQYDNDILDTNRSIQYKYASPFELVFGNTIMGIFAIFIAIGVIKLIAATAYGSTHSDNSFSAYGISNTKIIFEIVVMFVLNSIPSLLEPVIYGDSTTKKSVLLSFGMGSLSSILYIMFQYTGLYHEFLKR